MDSSIEINILRNVQATDGKSSVSKEFSHPERQQRRRPQKKDSGRSSSQKPAKGYQKEIPAGAEEERIDITI